MLKTLWEAMMSDNEFADALISLLKLLVPSVAIPNMPKPSGRPWDDDADEQLDQFNRECALAIKAHLALLDATLNRLEGLNLPREYLQVKRLAIETSEAYGYALAAMGTAYWLTGTSYAGDRYEKYQRADSDGELWSNRTNERAKKLLSELRGIPVELPNLRCLEHIADDAIHILWDLTGRKYI